MTVYVHNKSATEFNVYQLASGAPDLTDSWIKHRIYKYSAVPGDQWGWNGTRCGFVAILATTLHDHGDWNYVNGSGTNWAQPAGWVPGAESATHNEMDPGQDPFPYAEIDITLAGVGDIVLRCVIAANGGIQAVTIDGTTALVNGEDVNDSGLLDTYGVNGYQDYRLAKDVPAGSYTLRITGTGTKNALSSDYDLRIVALKVYDLKTTAVPGETDWAFTGDSVLQSEATSDDIAMNLREGAEANGFVLGPAHSGHEQNQVVTFKMDGGADFFGDVGDDAVTSGTSLVVTIGSDVHAPGVSENKVAELERTFTFSGDTLDYESVWTKKAADLTINVWYPSMWKCRDSVTHWLRAGGLTVWAGANLATTVYFPVATGDFDVWGHRSIVINHRNASGHSWPSFAVGADRKVYHEGDKAVLNALAVDETYTDAYTVTFSGVADPAGILAAGDTIYIDNALTIDAETGAVSPTELADALSGRIVKADGVAITVAAGEDVSGSIFTSFEDAARGAAICRTSALTPLTGPAAGEWTGLINSGNIHNCTIEYATAGVARTAGDLSNCIIDNCTDTTTGSGGTESNNIVDGAQELDALGIPTPGGNCDVGRGDPSARPWVGGEDLHGRPKLRADADAIGPVYPQRDDPENILEPLTQFAGEMT